MGHEPVGDDGDLRARMGDRGLAERDRVVGLWDIPADRAVHLLVLEEQDRVVVPDRGPEETGGVVRGRGHHDLQTRDVGEERLDRLGVIQGPVDAAAIRSADRHRDAIAVVAPVAHPGRLGDDLVEGREDEVGELDLTDRPEAVDRRPDRGPDDHRLRQRRVDDPVRPELRPQPVGREEDAALLADVLAQDDDRFVPPHLLGQRVADRLDERPRRHQGRSSSVTYQVAVAGSGAGSASA